MIDMGDDGEVANMGKRRRLGLTHVPLGRERGVRGQAALACIRSRVFASTE
jgi:hypothetical protein